ncbi:MAG TPA: hypothetical protein DCW52_06440 [Gammaproteobacteria bacterium]|nr:hypothetical protein [Gammaproteobacteria bacterium]
MDMNVDTKTANRRAPLAAKQLVWLRFKNTILVSICLISSACLSRISLPTTDPALTLLNSVAVDVSTMTRQVSEVQQASYPRFSEPNVTDPALLSKISVIDYVGSPTRLLQELATRIGYTYIQLGSQTGQYSEQPMPFTTTVSVRARQQSVINIVREIAAQVGNGIVVSVSESQQELRLEFL